MDSPLKDKTDLCFCNMCGLGDHTSEDCPNIIDKVLNKRTINLLQIAPKQEIMNSKNLHVVTRLGVRKYNNNQNRQVIQPIENSTKYPNMQEQNDTMLKIVELFIKETNQQRMSKDIILEEFLELLKEEHFVGRLVELLNMLKDCNENKEKCKKKLQLSHGKEMEDHDSQVDLEINGYMIKQVVVYFCSQVNILPQETWINMGQPNLHNMINYL